MNSVIKYKICKGFYHIFLTKDDKLISFKTGDKRKIRRIIRKWKSNK